MVEACLNSLNITAKYDTWLQISKYYFNLIVEQFYKIYNNLVVANYVTNIRARGL